MNNIVERGRRFFASLPQIQAGDVSSSQDAKHVEQIDKHLKSSGIVKINLQFEDNSSSYLGNLVLQLHKSHGHGLPITHSASRGWFWDVRPQAAALEKAATVQARSETMETFPWHTDCSYEVSPPRFFALQVLQPDRCGGGTLSVLDCLRLVSLLSRDARETLIRPEFRITVPPEFIKKKESTHIIGPLLWLNEIQGTAQLRFREDIITPLTGRGRAALQELHEILKSNELNRQVMNLTPQILPRGSIVAMDNRRWMHARNTVCDPHRHLRRVRWDAQPFSK
ncbi:hypothetical protein N7495_003332 [Penicillium taxi]|uniref:uncharacterized protein n=1 Tax=Penicillium taxi TaxID=168475 RepID=UPI00254593E7|nr:uncharacterized protein N7495_003332 [Penicillium taxi]KAJ5902804.1 hypothetical protein N7495_003332 [Penicillium taxi]